MARRKTDKQAVAFWLYLALICLWGLYGLRDSAAADTILRALSAAFELIITK